MIIVSAQKTSNPPAQTGPHAVDHLFACEIAPEQEVDGRGRTELQVALESFDALLQVLEPCVGLGQSVRAAKLQTVRAAVRCQQVASCKGLQVFRDIAQAAQGLSRPHH